ncbi:hypothetical protein G6011_10455 [Alternaria panax]|uniref:Metalloendopeptidase n=1 Tax=Alternaria panax TaxID=48097 RepID=A0AAD4NN73_9PLEO|nr:hypothetical protein G6011_10455 [Alternaria panax]
MLSNIPTFVLLASASMIKHKPGPNEIFSCGIPLPRFENGTRATSRARYFGETQAYPGQNGQGATDMFAGPVGKAPVRWPRNSENKVVIPYCYHTQEARETVLPILHIAIETWMSYLGVASKEAGHAISFKEHSTSDGEPIYCTPDREKSDEWNSALPHETLAIFWGGDKMGWSADVGLQPSQETPWENRLYVGDENCFHCAIHELGHVMGMIHEHQRSDRDTYIKVQYENIRDFEECWGRAKAKGDAKVTRSNICSNIRYALEYKCLCSAFIKGITGSLLPLFTLDPYDMYSIMHYESSSGGTTQCPNYESEESSNHCPIQVYIDYEDHDKGLTMLVPNLRPSDQDIKWVKHVYPYNLET